ncbi:MAG: hypothetical protein B7Z55_15565 [Planctomycetales bacterium 12-60-4]|nr:MAG: hypothetical protein B7Z55_15565 [Planctomycetales bacterium 12-60-4]
MSRAWQQPWAFQLAADQGWIPGKDPHPSLERPLFSWFSELPAASSEESPIWVEYTREHSPTGIERLRLTLRHDRMIGSRDCAALTIDRFVDDARSESRELLIDRTQFQAGQSPAKCLVWTDAKVTAAQQQADLALFRGLPLLKEYSPGPERYTKLPLRTDAFACQRVAAQCDHTPAIGIPKLRYRSDLWLSPEIPFGTARFELTISDPHTSEIQQREIWVASGSHPPVAPMSPVTIEMFDSSTPIVTQLRQ